MSRVLISALALNILSGSVVFAQPLNINPFPNGKPVVASDTQSLTIDAAPLEKPEIQTDFAKENEALQLERERAEALSREAEAAAARLEQERLALQAQADAEAQKIADEKERLRLENAMLSDKLAAEQDALRVERERVEAQKRLAEEEAARLSQEKEALAQEVATREAQREAEAQKKLEQQALEAARLEAENKKLAEALEKREALKAEVEAARVAREREEALQAEQAAEALRIQQQQIAEAQALERENAKLAEELAALSAQKEKEAEPVILEQLAPVEVVESDEVLSLKEKNRELAQELRAQNEKKRKQAEINMAMRALEAQKIADAQAQMENEPAEIVDAYAPDVKPLAMSDYDDTNTVDMVPMPMDSGPLRASDVIAVRASDLGLVDPELDAELEQPEVVVMRQQGAASDVDYTESSQALNLKPVAPAQMSRAKTVAEYEAAGLTVIPYPPQAGDLVQGSLEMAPQDAAPYRSANAGESVEDVLRSWSQAEGVGFLWKTTQVFDVLTPVSAQGDFGNAVQSLLDQYAGQDVRPVGQLSTDPVTGTRTLSILSE